MRAQRLSSRFPVALPGTKILKGLELEDEFILTLAAAAAATAGQSRLHSSANNLRFIVGNSSHTPSITLTALLHCPYGLLSMKGCAISASTLNSVTHLRTLKLTADKPAC